MFHWPKHGFIWKTRSQCSAEKGDKPVNILGLIQVPGLHPDNGLVIAMTLKITENKNTDIFVYFGLSRQAECWWHPGILQMMLHLKLR